jgi:hypothetical protein
MLEEYGKFSGFVTAAIGALIMAKVVVLAHGISFISRYPDKSLIYNAEWKNAMSRARCPD